MHPSGVHLPSLLVRLKLDGRKVRTRATLRRITIEHKVRAISIKLNMICAKSGLFCDVLIVWWLHVFVMGAVADPVEDRPMYRDVVMIVVDDLRPALGVYGDAKAVTPNMDALGSDGFVFSNAYAQVRMNNLVVKTRSYK